MDVKTTDINIYDYALPAERIAQFPLNRRDASKVLIYRNGSVSEDKFINLTDHLDRDSLLVFNNTRVINARLLFRKPTGAAIEVFCIEPSEPSDYQLNLGSTTPVVWKCMVGNSKKWKEGKLEMVITGPTGDTCLQASVVRKQGDKQYIRFEWDNSETCFGEIIEAGGKIPLPPYIKRESNENDKTSYQTVYSIIDGSVASPTAGLHFTKEMLAKLKDSGIRTAEVTLHIGAGTFQPVKSNIIGEHTMHREHYMIDKETVTKLLSNSGKLIAVGTTSVRTLESLYWTGVKLMNQSALKNDGLHTDQWHPYETDTKATPGEALQTLLNYMNNNDIEILNCSTDLIILPGYRFRMISGIITNFHQPRSTLLLLVSAWTGGDWKRIYDYALENNFRFLSYGDSSLLL